MTAAAPPANVVAEKTDEFAPSLNQLVEAIQSKNLDAVDEAFPGISANQHRAFEQLFDRAKTSALRIKVEKTPPHIVDGHATAKVTLTVTYNDPNSLAPTGAPYAYDAAWEARGGVWKLTELKSILPESR